jgi:hypothetical protein
MPFRYLASISTHVEDKYAFHGQLAELGIVHCAALLAFSLFHTRVVLSL